MPVPSSLPSFASTWYGRFSQRVRGGAVTVSDQNGDDRADTSLDPEARLIQQQTVEYVRSVLEAFPTVVLAWNVLLNRVIGPSQICITSPHGPFVDG